MAKARPTLRCLLDELRPELRDPDQRSALASGKVSSLGPLPLEDIVHPLLEKATEMLVGRSATEIHDLLISSVTDNPWYKVKSGHRLRGAAFIDRNGQVWLCAAGLRRDGDKSDFYTTFERQCANGSAIFLPTDDDYKRKLLEEAHLAENKRRTLLAARVATCVGRAARTHSTESIELPTAVDPHSNEPLDGASLVVDVIHGELDDVGEITLSIEVTGIASHGYDDVIFEVQSSLPGIPLSDWDVVPRSDVHHDPCWYVLVEPDWINRFCEEVERLGPDEFAKNPPDLLDGSDGFSHLVQRNGLTEAVVNGSPVRALCGRTFVPGRDPDDRDICPVCASHVQTLAHEHQAG